MRLNHVPSSPKFRAKLIDPLLAPAAYIHVAALVRASDARQLARKGATPSIRKAMPKKNQGAASAYTDLKLRSMPHQTREVSIYVPAIM
jgi:hypothetical protein